MTDETHPLVRLDGCRAYHGRSQLTAVEIAFLRRVERKGPLQLVNTATGPQYRLCNGGQRVDRRLARRLIEYRYLVPSDFGLFAGDPVLAQTWRTAPGDPVEIAEQLKIRLGSPA